METDASVTHVIENGMPNYNVKQRGEGGLVHVDLQARIAIMHWSGYPDSCDNIISYSEGLPVRIYSAKEKDFFFCSPIRNYFQQALMDFTIKHSRKTSSRPYFHLKEADQCLFSAHILMIFFLKAG